MIIVCVIFLNFCSVNKFKNELEFGNKLAKEGLWREAYFRWNKYLSEGNDTASIHNNLAVALESMGKYKEAEKEYKKAIELAPNNSFISSNYKSLKTFLGKKKNEN